MLSVPGGGDAGASRIAVESDLECAARDDTVLRADVYHPDDGARHPTLLCRTPYDKSRKPYRDTARALASAGYCVVVQDHRGRLASDGEYRWIFGPAAETGDDRDGYDAAEWAARLAWSDGRVGAWGHSNDGWSVWMMVSAAPPSLVTAFISGMVPRLSAMTFGLFETGRRLQWAYTQAAVDPRDPDRAGVTREEATRRWDEVERGKHLWRLPLESVPAGDFGHLHGPLLDYMEHAGADSWDFTDIFDRVTIPIMQMTGWWDRLVATVDCHAAITSGEPSGSPHRLLVGPWGHDSTELSGRIGPIDYGPEADASYTDLLRRWFDHQLKGIDGGFRDEEPVQLFVLGENRWRGAASWPPAGARPTPFYLHSAGAANTVFGNGGLSAVPPGGSATGAGRSDLLPSRQRSGADSDEYDYDPRDPVMSLMRRDSQLVPIDQSPHDRREDVLVYETGPLDDDLELIGPASLRLWASTDGPDTDWAARLAVVHADGTAVNLTYGILRASQRHGHDRTEAVIPGEVVAYTVPLNPVGIRLRAGERLRLYVSSSDFPNFDRNHNTGAPYWSDSQLRVAHQVVHHSAARPSHLVLPVTSASVAPDTTIGERRSKTERRSR